jgi:hypothetical protein
MARASIDPSDGSWSLESMAHLLDAPAPRTPMEFLELERRVLAAAGQQADGILGCHLIRAHQDPGFVSQAVEMARDHQGPLRHKGQRTTSVWLPGGTLCVVETPYMRPPTPRRPGPKRRRRGPAGAGVYPVLEALGIANRVSPATRSEMALYTVQAGSYQEAVVLLAEQGLQVDSTTLRRVAQSTAQADIALRDAALDQARRMPVAPDGPLAGLRVRVSVDGGRVRTRVERPGRKTKKGRHRFDTPWREPRVLLIDVLDRNGKADRLRLPLYDVLLEDADTTVAVIIGYLRLLGAAHAKVVELIADGVDWLWDRSDKIRQEAEIPSSRWVEVVDFYHASQYLHGAVELCRNRKASERTQWYEKLRHVLRRDPHGVGKVIEALRPEACGRRGRKMNTAIQYFERHSERMAYVDLDRRHLPVGSGPVESAIRRVVNLRFKAPSIFWEADNVAELMHLRAAFKCGRWHEMLERVLTQTFPVPCFARLPPDQIHAVMPLASHANDPPTQVDHKRA